MLTLKNVFDAVEEFIVTNKDIVEEVCREGFEPSADPGPAYDKSNWTFLNPATGAPEEGDHRQVSVQEILDEIGDNELIFDCEHEDLDGLRVCVIIENEEIDSIYVVVE